MSFNITFLIQMIAFAIFVFICMKWIWPPLIGEISNRQKKIEESLQAAEKAKQSVSLAEENASKIISDAKVKAQEIVDQAESQKSKLIDNASDEARAEKERIIKSATIETAKNKAQEELRKEISKLAIAGAEKIISSKVSSEEDDALVKEALKQF